MIPFIAFTNNVRTINSFFQLLQRRQRLTFVTYPWKWGRVVPASIDSITIVKRQNACSLHMEVAEVTEISSKKKKIAKAVAAKNRAHQRNNNPIEECSYFNVSTNIEF